MLLTNKINQYFKNKKIIILGAAREGLDTLEFLKNILPKKIIGLADKKNYAKLEPEFKKRIFKFPRVRLHLGKSYLKSLDKYELIIRSPGVALTQPALIQAKKKGKIITSQTKIFFKFCSGNIIGVTGTKGKGTTSSLIYQILKQAGKDTELIGNIGKPALSFLKNSDKNSIFVFELSSHQLADLDRSPHIAVVLNIVAEHLDYYRNFKEYIAAKKSIVCFQRKNDYVIYNASSPVSRSFGLLSKAKKIPYYIDKQKCPGCFIKKDFLVYCSSEKHQEKIIALNQIPLLGKFNLQNVMPAIIVAKLLGIKTETIKKAIKTFKSLPHRLELVGTYKGISFYNDSLATNPYATIAALATLGDKVETIFLGGHDRNLDFSSLAKKIAESKIKTIILFPECGERIWQEIEKVKKRNLPRKFLAASMEEAVRSAYKFTSQGKICLLSCAAPSFGLFKDYQDRGSRFKKIVNKLKND